MPLLNSDLRKEFLAYINQPESCELFYIYMKSEQLAYVLEFYLACDGLKNLADDKKNQCAIIKLIFKHYLSHGKSLSSSTIFSLPDDLLSSIKQCLTKHEFHLKFYDQAQEYVLKYMLQMCYPKFLIEQQNSPETKRQALTAPKFTPMHRRCISIRKKDVFEKFKQQSNLSSLESSTVIADNQIGLNSSKQSRSTKVIKQEKNLCSLAQRNPSAFFEEIKTRLLAYQTEIPDLMIGDDPFAVLDLQIAKTIDDADNFLNESSIDHFTRYDSGVGTDSSEKNYETFCTKRRYPSIDVIWNPSLDSNNALLSTIPRIYNRLTFKEFRQLFKKQTTYRYFFKTICTPDINKEQYVYRELTMDDELVPFFDGKIFVQLDRIY
ncbi:unnamed protein product [Rotaria socialis]|nr:unnamed protein product [Rotaria socialis]CAF3410454.1 unnamed protein product [Rotaria socialis]CAF3441589.1 unnamed protein product [Rotaria socialis]CAF4786834.1 unnamed protein product [Rotaria socialis]